MITIRKLKTLKPGTLRRKAAVILQLFENELSAGCPLDLNYLYAFLELTSEAYEDSSAVAERIAGLMPSISGQEPEQLHRSLNSLRHLLLQVLGTEPADWDLSETRSPVTEGTDPPHVKAGIEIFLDDLRSPFNLGSIFRTSEAFGVSRILLSPDCPDPEHPRASRSAMGCTRLVPWERVKGSELFSSEAVISGEITVFALELGGTPVSGFRFPEKGIAVIGSEELGISPEARNAALKSGGLVSIPVFGKKGSINVSVAFGIMMQRWSEQLF